MNDFNKCLKAKKIISAVGIEKSVSLELKEAKNDLEEAKSRFGAKKYKYATVTGYYALFHAARALLYSAGYREKSHHCLRIAIEELFAKQELISPEHLEFFDDALGLREAADYEGAYTKKGAQGAIKRAEKFLAAATKILEKD